MGKKLDFFDIKEVKSRELLLETEEFGPLVRNAVIGSVVMRKEEALGRLKFLLKEYPTGFQSSVEWIKESRDFPQYWELLIEEYKEFGKGDAEKDELPSFATVKPVRAYLKGRRKSFEEKLTTLFYDVFHGKDKETQEEALGKIKFILNDNRSTFLATLKDLHRRNAPFARKFLKQYPMVKDLLRK